MVLAPNDAPTSEKPLRLWPGVVAVGLQWLIRYGVPLVFPQAILFAVLGGLAGGLVVLVWWAFFSRIPHLERWGGLALVIVAVAVTPIFLDQSIATAMMGMMFGIYVIPVLCLALVAWAVLRQRLAKGPRRVALVAAIFLACGLWTLFRSDGMTGEGGAELAWRWSATPEERLLAAAGDELAALSGAPAVAEGGVEWPGFRGPGRDSILPGVRIATDWAASPPVELWRRPVGPGWSSFALQGNRLYTQEQRGDDEVVACYDATTGEPLWAHLDPVRFWEANAGAGPRATPTLHGGRVYTLGATGLVNALDALDGSLVWSRDAAADAKAKVPYWGFSGSPLVVDDLVLIAASGQLVAYDLASGEPRWFGPEGGESYSSPHLVTLDGVSQVLLLSEAGLASVATNDGTLLWEHAWKGYPIVQPASTADGDVLLSVNQDSGLRRLAVAQAPGGWTVTERWTSLGLKPYFNDFVVHEGHAYGIDGSILACIQLEDGERRWKGGRYGGGQLVLLPDQDLLLVLSEKGELALVAATPEAFRELARFPAIEGKTWNHPVLAGDVLVVRNDHEMAAFRLSPASS